MRAHIRHFLNGAKFRRPGAGSWCASSARNCAREGAAGAAGDIGSGQDRPEGLGEVQEMIDICDYAVGLSRQLYGLSIASERPNHRMIEQWHPLGVVGVITAFNFPVAVWAWNAALAIVCGDPVIWKPSEKTPLTAAAVMALAERALKRFGDARTACCNASRAAARWARRWSTITVSRCCRQQVRRRWAGQWVHASQSVSAVRCSSLRNNAMIVAPSADLKLTERAILFSAAGTAGQRCTTLRRLIVHESIADELVARLRGLFGRVKIGDPREPGTLVGPLIDEAAFEGMKRACPDVERVEVGEGGFYVRPAIVEVDRQEGMVRQETLRPSFTSSGIATWTSDLAEQ